VYDNIKTENWKKKRKYQVNCYINLHLRDGLGLEVTACYGELMPEGTLTLLIVCEAYRYFAGPT